jgi:threonine 3-dehydrogenase
MKKTMNALVKAEPKEGLWLQEIPVPDVGKNDVRIRILKSSICGTDVHIWNWDAWAQKTIPVPMAVGHEFVGVIDAVGSNVEDFGPGELVSGEGHVVCGRCRNCMAGRRNLCPNTSSVGVNRPGAHAEYLVIPVTNVWAANKDIPLEVTSCFDPLGNATHTALSFDVLGEDVLITGAGPIGCMAVGIAKYAGARYIVVSDINPYRLELAKRMGATLALDVRTESIADAQKTLGMKEGFDVGMEMSGSPDAFRSMLENMCHGGKVAMLGILPKTEVDWDHIVFNGLTIKGIYGREMYETWYKMTVMIQGGLDITPVITHRFPYSDFQEAFEVMRSGQSGKVVLDWSQ